MNSKIVLFPSILVHARKVLVGSIETKGAYFAPGIQGMAWVNSGEENSWTRSLETDRRECNAVSFML